jgi:GT2 family glycosyltransferase
MQACAASVLASPRQDVELIVADQSVDDDTERVVTALHDPRVRYLRLHQPGKERAQNEAVASASAPLVVFTDDDCEVSGDWLDALERVFDAEPDAAIVYGSVVAPPHDASTLFIPTFEPPARRRIVGLGIPAHRCGIGANMAVRRDAFGQLGGFETAMGPGSRYRSGGDWEIAYRALRAGFVVVQTPDAIVTHHGSRRYEGGEVRRLISNNYFGIGAGYGIHTRRGDVRAVWHWLSEVGRTSSEIVRLLVRRARPLGVRRLTALGRGFAVAVAYGAPRDEAEPAGGR